MTEKPILPAHKIVFGLDRQTDECSIKSFIRRFADPTLLDTLVPRLQDQELNALLDLLSSILGRHFTEKEYHNLFLSDR